MVGPRLAAALKRSRSALSWAAFLIALPAALAGCWGHSPADPPSAAPTSTSFLTEPLLESKSPPVAYIQPVPTFSTDEIVADLPSLDFCKLMDRVAGSLTFRTILAVDPTALALISRLYCHVPPGIDQQPADINGGIDLEAGLGRPNGMDDGRAELGLIAKVLSDASIDLSGGTALGQVSSGVDHVSVRDAFVKNIEMIREDFGAGIIDVLAAIDSKLARDLLQLLSGYLLIGDAASVELIGALRALMPEEILADSRYGLEDFVTLENFFGPLGDADGDGHCNLAEYRHFYRLEDPGIYVRSALDPTVVPAASPDCPPLAVQAEATDPGE